MRSGTHTDLLFWSKSHSFAIKNHSLGWGPIETSNSDDKHAVVHAQNDRSCLGLIETCYSVPEDAVLHGKATGGGWDPQRLVILGLKSLFFMHKTAGKGWNPYSLDTLVLRPPLCLLKATDEVWDPYGLVSLVLKSLFSMHKTTGEGWTP